MRRRLIDWANANPSPLVGALTMVFVAELICGLGLFIAWLLGCLHFGE